jgi:hypothetical protein
MLKKKKNINSKIDKILDLLNQNIKNNMSNTISANNQQNIPNYSMVPNMNNLQNMNNFTNMHNIANMNNLQNQCSAINNLSQNYMHNGQNITEPFTQVNNPTNSSDNTYLIIGIIIIIILLLIDIYLRISSKREH